MSFKFKGIIQILCSMSLLASCSTTEQPKDAVKNEASALKKNTLDFVIRNSKDAFDEVYPIFNSELADTKYNKERFREFLQVPTSSDVKNIYCYIDDFEDQPDYMFSFNCSKETAAKIIKKHQLELTTQNDRGLSQQEDDFPWWNKRKIQQLPFYKNTPNNEEVTNKYFWFDKKNNMAYFFEFTL